MGGGTGTGGETDMHKPGQVCVYCSHPDNVEWQRQVFHPAYRGCVLRNGVKEVEE